MKIALLAPISHPIPSFKYAPWEKVVNTLANGLVDQGHDVTVIATKEAVGRFNVYGTVDKTLEEIDETDVLYGRPLETLHITEAIKYVNKNNFDVLNNHLNWYGMLGCELSKTPYVTTLHGFDPIGLKIFNKYKTNNFISISNSERLEAPDLNYVNNVYNGIDFNFFKLNEKREDYFFLAARITRDKGIANAIRLAQITNIPLYFAGIIQDEKYYKEEVEPYIDNKFINYLGNLSQEEVEKYVSKALAYVSLIEFDEPFGLSVGEAIATGTPVIATKRGSMVELVKDGVSGVLVDTIEEAAARMDSIRNIKPDECRRFGEELFSIDKMIEGYLDTYKKII